MARTRDDGEQLALPYPPTRGERFRHVARRTGAVLGRMLETAVRWLLRLALPLLCAAALLQAFPYHATVQGVPFEVQGSLVTRPGLSADTTLGSWEFPTVSGVPFGVHVAPEDVDVLELTRLAGGDMPAFVERLQADFTAQLPRIGLWLVGELLLGIAIGLAIAAAIGMSVRYLRGRPRREHELRRRVVQGAGAALVVCSVAAYAVLSYNPNWVRESRLTGTLAAAQLFPDQLSQYYSRQSKALDVLGSVLGIQAALQAQIDQEQSLETAFRIMIVSDMHLAANWPLVGQYATNYDVDLIVDAGDESEFGTREELTGAFLDGLAAVAAQTPVLWIGGNHDSPATEAVMRTVPGVTVLGTKTATADGYEVTAGMVRAYGLTIAGLSDPRVYGASGRYGADDPEIVDPLQREAVQEAVGTADGDEGGDEGGGDEGGGDEGGGDEGGETVDAAADASGAPDGAGTVDPAAAAADTEGSDDAAADGDDQVDVFLTHEPVAAEALREELPGRIRQTVSGHVHAQNDNDELQDDDGAIDLVEGSTGAGGLDNIVRGKARPPIQFSIQSVGADCQFTRVVRFSIESAGPVLVSPPTATTPQAFGDDVTSSTVYFRPQEIDEDRTCGTQLGITDERPWPGQD